jgi:enoyl-CoA hydratase/carnithine racemase
MTDKPRVSMTPDELALELFTTGQEMTGGRAEAERLLQQIKDRHAHTLAGQQRAAADKLDAALKTQTETASTMRNTAALIDPQAA